MGADTLWSRSPSSGCLALARWRIHCTVNVMTSMRPAGTGEDDISLACNIGFNLFMSPERTCAPLQAGFCMVRWAQCHTEVIARWRNDTFNKQHCTFGHHKNDMMTFERVDCIHGNDSGDSCSLIYSPSYHLPCQRT